MNRLFTILSVIGMVVFMAMAVGSMFVAFIFFIGHQLLIGAASLILVVIFLGLSLATTYSADALDRKYWAKRGLPSWPYTIKRSLNK